MNNKNIKIITIIGFIVSIILLILGPILIGLIEMLIPFNPLPLGVFCIVFGIVMFICSFMLTITLFVD